MGGCEREVCLVAIIYSSLKFTPSLRYKYDALFDSLNPIDGKVTGASAKGWFRFPHQYSYIENFSLCMRDDQIKIAQQRSWQDLEIE